MMMRFPTFFFFFFTAAALFMPMVCAEVMVPIERIVMTMTSDIDSDPDTFPGEVLKKTDEFLRLILNQEYGDNFDRVSLSIISEGISPSSRGGFYDTLIVKGTSYWTQDAPSLDELTSVVLNAFVSEIDVFIEVLAESPDPFLGAINDIEIDNANTDTTNNNNEQGNRNGDGNDSGLNLWIVAVAVAATALCSFLLFCIVCVCCLGDDEGDDDDQDIGLKQTDSEESKPQTQASEIDEENPQLNRMPSGYSRKLDMEGILDDRSLMSQDSSKFTYNPKSVVSTGEFTFQTKDNDGPNTAENPIFWKPSNESSNVLTSMSRIENMNDSLVLSESEVNSPTGTLGEMSDITDFNTLEERKRQQQAFSTPLTSNKQPPQSASKTGAASSILDDLEDLSQMVNSHRKGENPKAAARRDQL